MNQHAPQLLSELNWDGLTANNRVVMSPMTRGRAGETMTANPLMARYYAQRASAGVIITEGTFISPEAVGWNHAPGIWTDKQGEAWKPVIDAVHQHRDTPIFLQLWHTGRASHSDFHDGSLPVAPSAIRHEGDKIHTPSGDKKPHETPRALETDEIPRLIEDYRQAALRAKSAGFDGVEIHSANGYLLDEFLQSKTNHRTDQYGGSLENRYRLLSEILGAVRTVFDASRIGVRISPNGSFNDMGSPDFRETFLYVAKQLNETNLAWLDVLDGLAFGFHELGEPITLKDIREVYHGRLMANCGYDRDQAEQAVADGLADFVAFGRPYISNPDLVERFANNWTLNDVAPQSVWYSPGPEGYIDFPTYQESETKSATATG
ncbi:alkene reductase [Rubripirellula reticaptiva]|uniref:N-ethylmaleimide reductase n=1 Tax=Rubripirellula reticaptiva TaxID=2528013 RepID=A0A5C6EF40_9BACT|nr:alkene reductase [Rubripirellula reticaptiva]TWU46637.1 N-ethylmaleimide reductase [Rubripirellula reticaptiva]